MAKKFKAKKVKTKADPTKISRTTWGTCNPVQRKHADKTKYTRKTKHKNKED